MINWSTLGEYIDQGIESRKVDLKLLIDLSNRPSRAEFAKDVSAMANTPGGRGYLIIGVKDRKDRIDSNPDDYIVGFDPPDFNTLEQQMEQALETFCQPVPNIQFAEIRHPDLPQRTIGVVIVPRQFQRPYAVVQNSGKVAAGCYIRRGSHTYQVPCEEITAGPTAILVNFGRQIETGQQLEIENQLGLVVDEIITVPHQLDDTQPHQPQILALLRQTGLTEDEWMSLPMVVNVHPFAPDAAAVIACIHGLRGNFPDIVRMSRNPQTQKFEVTEIFRLQALRNSARSQVAAL